VDVHVNGYVSGRLRQYDIIVGVDVHVLVDGFEIVATSCQPATLEPAEVSDLSVNLASFAALR